MMYCLIHQALIVLLGHQQVRGILGLHQSLVLPE